MNDLRTPRDARDGADDAHDDVRRAYRALADEPVPPALDASVLDMARAAVRPTRVRPRWIVPASLAATVLVAVGLSLDVKRESTRDAQQYAGESRATKAESAAMDASAPNGSATAPIEAPVAAPMEAARPAPFPAQQNAAVAPAVAAANDAERGASRDATGPPPQEVGIAIPQRASSTAAPAAAPPMPVVRPIPAAPPPALDMPAVASTARSEAAPPVSAEAQRAVAPESAETLQRMASPAAKSAPYAAARDEARPPRTREQWLKDIEALRRAGRTADAEAELARFRAAYPDPPPR
jgi:hypothetical protein